MAASELNRSLCNCALCRRVSKVRGNKIRFASCRQNFSNRLFAAFPIAANDQNMNAELG
jgi:hypothetical protein